MDALEFSAEVLVELVGIERSERCQQPCNGHQTGVQRVVSTLLVSTHFLAPETLAVQTDVPVAEVVVDESVNQPAGTRRVKVLQLMGYTLYE